MKALVCLLLIVGGVNLYGQDLAGTALQFDGNNDFVMIDDHPSLNPSAQITLEAWVYSEQMDRGSWQEFIMKGGNSSSEPRQYYIRPRRSEGRLEFRLHDTSDNSEGESSDSMLTNGVWHHVAGTYDGEEIRIYINGILQGSDSVRFMIQSSDQPLTFGRLGSISAEYFSGRLDEVRIWNTARSHIQLKTTMDDTLGPAYYTSEDSGLVGYWRFDEAEGDSVRDLSLYGNHGRIEGAVFVPSGALTDMRPIESGPVKKSFSLMQNYPNPFNPSTMIKFTLPNTEFVQLNVYNSLGQIVNNLIDDQLQAGSHEIEFNASHLSSGVYIYRLRAGSFVDVKKLILLK